MSYSQQDLLLDSFQDCLIAVYGAMELALRSAEAFNDTLRPSMAQVVFMRVLRLIWLLFFVFFPHWPQTEGSAASHSVDHSLGQTA